MFSHVMVGTNDPEQAFAFYDATFGALGVPSNRMKERAFYGEPGKPMFAVGKPANGGPATHANGGTIGFQAKNRATVDAWYAAGLANGGSDEGAPGERPYGDPPIYGAYMRDPDGNKLCAFCPPGL